jgi:hypothetical protein
MSENRERAALIRFWFSTSYLFEHLFQEMNPNRYDIEASAKRYATLCEEALRRAYPNTNEIEVHFSITGAALPSSKETLVYIWEDGKEIEEPNEGKFVEELCERIHTQFDWPVMKPLIPVVELKRVLHPSVIRWACTHGFVEGAGKPSGHWEILSNSLSKIKGDVEKQLLICSLEDMKDISIAELMTQGEILVITGKGFGIYPFTPNASYIQLARRGPEVHIGVEHFVDVEKWSDPQWSYSSYAESLITQARRKGVLSETQTNERNGLQITDGVSFHFKEPMKANITLFELVNRILQSLSEIVTSAELSLAGGPVWEEIYEKAGQESRFRDKILEPLLKNMNYLFVHNTHGDDEFGRDFILAEMTQFQVPIYYGVQAKVRNISGGANAEIDKILAQIDKAFAMPYTKLPGKSNSEIYIAAMIIATSGNFTKNAVETIRYRTPHHLNGSLYFWDKPKIQSLISHYWGRNIE